MIERDQLFIGGRWRPPTIGDGVIEVENPATEEVLGRVPAGGPVDIDAAVAAAWAAFDSWAATPVEERAAAVQRMADGLGGRVAELGELIAREVGTPLQMATLVQAGAAALVMGTYPGLARSFSFEKRVGHSVVVQSPVGVVGCLTPWNYPLYLAVCKVAPALAAGCTVVLKPSEVAPLSAFVLAEVVEAAGLPPGVFNLVSGGPEAGEALVAHPGVDMISFTGSTEKGRRVGALAAGALKRVTLELGGKSANVILDDADLDEAVRAGVGQCFLNSGQTCIAWSRMLVPADRHDEAAALAKAVVDEYVLGDPLDPATTLGPLASRRLRQRVCDAIAAGIDEGASLVSGGAERPAGLHRGWFVQPTVLAGVTPDMAVANEEIFGPVLALMPYADEDEAVRIANGTAYGLHGAVYSGGFERAQRVARRLRTGQVDINGAGFNLLAPFGGWKQSGWGRELGAEGLSQYLDTTSLQLPPARS